MIQEFKNMRAVYQKLGSNTKLVIRITLICVITLLSLAIYTYTASDNPLYYEFLTICDELLNVTKSIAIIGFIGTLAFGYIEK